MSRRPIITNQNETFHLITDLVVTLADGEGSSGVVRWKGANYL